MGSKHPKQHTNQDQHHKDSEQHVPQFIVENLSFTPMATCQFTATTPRNRNNKEFLALLDMVERLQDTHPDSNMDHYHCCGYCIDDCIAGQWVVLLGCGHTPPRMPPRSHQEQCILHMPLLRPKTTRPPKPSYKRGARLHEGQQYCVSEPHAKQFPT